MAETKTTGTTTVASPTSSRPPIGSVIAKEEWFNDGLSIMVVGASGDLAKKKTYPSLLALYADGLLPDNTVIWGYARSAKTHEELRAQIKPYLIKNDAIQETTIDAFLARCYYKNGKSYGDEEAWKELMCFIQEHEQGYEQKERHNRLFYLAIPPNVFGETGVAIKRTAMQETGKGWSRLIIEKPFGRDLESCEALSKVLSNQFDEHHLYRIDHYLGKEVVQNMLVLRFGNSMFEWMWNRNAVQSVLLTFKEPFGTEGRGGYFDNYGIIRDILQNHLLQVLMLVAMEPPVIAEGTEASDFIRDAKYRVLMSMPEIQLEDCLLGQYDGYTDDETIQNKDTNCPTYAAIRCFVNSTRWSGVPFIMQAGKALDERVCEVRVQFREAPACNVLFPGRKMPQNELVMRLQPNPAIYFTSNVKSPGFASKPTPVAVGMNYKDISNENPDAYTRLILDVLRGRQGSFVRSDELRRSWEIFTPLLHKIERENVRPVGYKYGSKGPEELDSFMKKMGAVVGPQQANL